MCSVLALIDATREPDHAPHQAQAAHCILLAIAADGYSTVVVGTHGRGRVAGAVIGSTAARDAEAAGVSVLLVPS